MKNNYIKIDTLFILLHKLVDVITYDDIIPIIYDNVQIGYIDNIIKDKEELKGDIYIIDSIYTSDSDIHVNTKVILSFEKNRLKISYIRYK